MPALTPLPAGAYTFKAVATDTVGNTASAADQPFLVATSGAGSTGSLVLNLSETPISGQDAQFTVSVDGVQIGGVETITALHNAGQSQTFDFSGNFGSGAATSATCARTRPATWARLGLRTRPSQ